MSADQAERVPRQATLARLARFGIAPRRGLGQNFLVDDNILRLIIDRLHADRSDVVLEVGTGLGILTEALLKAAGRVHSFEIDTGLRNPLLEVFGDEPRLTLHFGDVMTCDLSRLDPSPTLCASNLPYSIAAPFLAETVVRLPGIRRYVVMIQREVAERLTAAPGNRTYGGVSAWIQLMTEIEEIRSLSRKIFYPEPHVDSSLLTLVRRPVTGLLEEDPWLVRWVIEASFAARRKMIVNSLSTAAGLPKEEVDEALRTAGISPASRAEQVPPSGYVALAETFRARGWRPPGTRGEASR